jgi:hypothetical protein
MRVASISFFAGPRSFSPQAMERYSVTLFVDIPQLFRELFDFIQTLRDISCQFSPSSDRMVSKSRRASSRTGADILRQNVGTASLFSNWSTSGKRAKSIALHASRINRIHPLCRRTSI